MEALKPGEAFYPDSDGQPMSDNTRQFKWIVRIKENLDALLPDFVAGDLLWYPVEGQPRIRIGPDVLVALGRPKGERGSYKQWEEDGIAPQVVFEILSPGNTPTEMMRKLSFYQEHGVLEFYLYDPDLDVLSAWCRESIDKPLRSVEDVRGWTSPLLQIRFDTGGEELIIYRPDGEPFHSLAELHAAREQAEARAEKAEKRAERLQARLLALGIDIEAEE